MAAQPKTQAAKALITRTIPKERLLDMVASGWTQQRIADEIRDLTGQSVSTYYVCRTLQSFGPDYDAAKKAQAEMHANKLAEIADQVEQGKLDAPSARVSSDNRRWLASKLNPQAFGDRVGLDVHLTDVTQLHLEQLRSRMRDITPRE